MKSRSAVASAAVVLTALPLSHSLCRYIKRRAREAFSSTPEPSKAAELMAVAKQEMEVVKRQAVVFNLYARKHKNVMVSGKVLLIA